MAEQYLSEGPESSRFQQRVDGINATSYDCGEAAFLNEVWKKFLIFPP